MFEPRATDARGVRRITAKQGDTMDTQTGKIVDLDEEQARQAEMTWRMFEAGLTNKMPRYAPVTGDRIPTKPRKRHKRTKAKRSYRDWCN